MGAKSLKLRDHLKLISLLLRKMISVLDGEILTVLDELSYTKGRVKAVIASFND